MNIKLRTVKRRKSSRGAFSKAKGGEFERSTCKGLSLWMSRGLRDDLFWRSAMSGGRASVRFKKGAPNRAQAGDISAIDPIGERLTRVFLLECKCYKNLCLSGLFFTSRTDGINLFWRDCVKKASDFNRLPFLIARQNQFPTLVGLSREGKDKVGLGPPAAWFPEHDLFVYFLTDFLAKAHRP